MSHVFIAILLVVAERLERLHGRVELIGQELERLICEFELWLDSK